MTLTQFQSTHEINLTGSFLLIRSFLLRLSQLPSPLESAPSIILIGSTAGQLGEANHADYASSKSALTHGFMLSIKNEIVKMDRRGRICTVAPGWVGTKMAEESLKDEGIKYMAMAT
jgi:NAD(P)-dependent dehydrogenase (short-subunit alcohol dehydrogenase family)